MNGLLIGLGIGAAWVLFSAICTVALGVAKARARRHQEIARFTERLNRDTELEALKLVAAGLLEIDHVDDNGWLCFARRTARPYDQDIDG